MRRGSRSAASSVSSNIRCSWLKYSDRLGWGAFDVTRSCGGRLIESVVALAIRPELHKGAPNRKLPAHVSPLRQELWAEAQGR